MTVTMESQGIIPHHQWQGIASAIVGATSVIINLLLFAIAMSGTSPTEPVATALLVISSGMLCANLVGIALGVLGARDRASRKLYPLVGLSLNAAVPMILLLLALFSLAVGAH